MHRLAREAVLILGLGITQNVLAQEPVSVRALKVLNRCTTCHGNTKPEGGLNLTTRQATLKGGISGASLLPGKPQDSLLFKRVLAKQMPPNAPLSAAETITLKEWIATGAKWGSPDNPQRADKDWWALRPLQQKPSPSVRQKAWVKNLIDAHTLARLESEGLKPAPPADKSTLLRRVTYDLIGLPPTPQETDAFLKDTAPNAYEKQLNRLLADPRYGERWARHWLDVVRFGESHGFERDQIRPHSWRYRDYVIDALNADKPYNQFVIEQIAGDALQPSRKQGIVATGFLVAAPWDEVGHSQVSSLMRARVREEELEDMIGTVGQTFLGLTVNCARCHDHKFDPILQKDYYRFKAALDGAQHGNRSLLVGAELTENEARIKSLNAKKSEARATLRRLELTGRERVTAQQKPVPTTLAVSPLARWTFDTDGHDALHGIFGTLYNGAKIEGGRLILGDNGGFVSTSPLHVTLREKTLEAWVRIADLKQKGGGVISVQAPDGHVFDSLVFGEMQEGRWLAGSEAFHRTRSLSAPKETARPDEWVQMAVVYAADNSIQLYRNGMPYGERYTPTGTNASLRTFPAKESVILFGLRHTGAGNGAFRGEIAEARIYDRALSSEEIGRSYKSGFSDVPLKELLARLTPDERASYEKAQRDTLQIEASLASLQLPNLTYAANSVQPPPTTILLRGDVEKPADTVLAGAIESIADGNGEFGLAANAPEVERRLRLAQWIASPRNPLTWRVVVNRIWHYHFGRGIVASPNDFGFNGERPTHPELLDALAGWFLKTGGSLKALHRLILLSNTYQQSALYAKRAGQKDAENRLLWRFAPRRMEAEVIRDSMLSVCGQLNPKQGGPSFQPFTVEISNSHFYHLFDSPLPEYSRRSIYRIQVHSAKSPLLETLDCPDPSTKTPRRAMTTTPLQALELMNNTFITRQAKELAIRVSKESGKDPSIQVSSLYRIVLGRKPNAKELKRAVTFVHAQSLETLCWTLLNSSEFLYLR